MNEGLVKVKCVYFKYGKRPKNCLYTSERPYNCYNPKNPVECEGYSLVSWTFYLMNKKHLDEVKDDEV